MDAGLDTFALNIPPGFQRDVLAGRSPALQLNVDATRMSQAFTGSAYIQTIVTSEVDAFLQGRRATTAPPVDLVLRARFNPNLTKVLVRGGGAAHQPGDHALHHPHRRGADPRARARDHRAPAGHAGHAAPDHGQQGLGDGAGGARGRRGCPCWLVVRGLLAVPVEGSIGRCSWPARRCTCSRPPPWASSWPPSGARCRSSPCC